MKYYKIDVKILEEYLPAYFTGSQLRGALGYGLKRCVCINPSYECEGCFASANCIFSSFFKEDSYHKYRFDILLGKDKLDFSLYLFDDACDKLAFILSSLHRVFTTIGIGKGKRCFSEFEIYINEKIVYDGFEFKLTGIEPSSFSQSEYKKDVVVNILTPIRIKRLSQFILDDELDLFDILLSSKKRYSFIYEKNKDDVILDKEYEIINKTLYKKKLTRYSNAKKCKMSFDGMMGSLIIKNLSEQNFQMLKIAELLSVGKQTVFGLGKIEVKGI